jgi:hypothetical protein
VSTTGRDASQLLDVDVQQFSGLSSDVPNWLPGKAVKVDEPRTASSDQDGVDRRTWHLEHGAESMRSPALMAPNRQDVLSCLLGQAAWAVVGSTGAVLQSNRAFDTVPADPLVRGGPRDTHGLCRAAGGPASTHSLDEQLSAHNSQLRSTM